MENLPEIIKTNLIGTKHPLKQYLNFTVELIVGKIVLEQDGRKFVQYSVELMEIKKADNS